MARTASFVMFLLLSISSTSLAAPPLPDSKVAKVFFDCGSKLYLDGQFALVITEYDKAIRLDPTNALAFACRGFCWLNKGDLKRAVVDYSEAIKLDPKNHTYFRDRGVAFGLQQEWDKAEIDLYQAILLNPNDADSFYARCDGSEEKGMGQSGGRLQ